MLWINIDWFIGNWPEAFPLEINKKPCYQLNLWITDRNKLEIFAAIVKIVMLFYAIIFPSFNPQPEIVVFNIWFSERYYR